MNLTYLQFRNIRRFIVVDKLNLVNSNRLYGEALDLIPGAILGIRRPYNFVEGEYPIFFETAKGGNVIDVDGNEYMDMLCAYGPIIIGVLYVINPTNPEQISEKIESVDTLL